ncbi:hypothetical protein H4Q26_018076 [Puccinia striiformis f. sp. tritici PST-130]|nr:hypothetical protein H4Q26_018076 [Puccinia striiformis f. sp. tritici PST-130]
MAVDPATRPTTRRPDRPATANRHRADGRPRRGQRPKLGGSTVGGRRRARDRLEAPGPKTGRTGDGRVSPAPPTLLRRPEPDPPRSSEPILIPKLRIGFADFPYLHYSMRLEAAHLGDLLRISVRTDAKTPRGPLSNFQEDSRDVQRSQRKENSSRTPRRLLRVHSGRPDETKEPRTLGSGSASGSGIRTGFPLAPWAIRKRLRPWYEDLSPGLGSTDSWTTAVHKKPFSTAAPEAPLEYLLLPPRSAPTAAPGGLATCPSTHTAAPSYSSGLAGTDRRERRPAPLCRRRPSIGTTLQRHPFSELVASAADSDFHGHRPAVISNQRLSWSLNTRRFRRLNSAFGSSRSASSAYQKWPTKRLGFRRRLRTRFTRCTSYPEGNFGGNQLLDGSISLSPLYPSQTNDLHGAPPDGRSRPGGDAPGLRTSATLNAGGSPLTRAHVRLLGPCFKTGRKVARNSSPTDGPRLRRGRVDGSCRRASRPGAPGFGAIGHAETRPPRRTATRALRPAPNESRRPLTERKIRPAVRPTVNSPGGDSRALSVYTRTVSPLDGVYHPLRAALSSNPTRRRGPIPERCDGLYWPGTICGPWPRSRETWTVTCAPATRPARTPQLPYVPRHKIPPDLRSERIGIFSMFTRQACGPRSARTVTVRVRFSEAGEVSTTLSRPGRALARRADGDVPFDDARTRDCLPSQLGRTTGGSRRSGSVPRSNRQSRTAGAADGLAVGRLPAHIGLAEYPVYDPQTGVARTRGSPRPQCAFDWSMFTYGNLVTTFTSSKRPSSVIFPVARRPSPRGGRITRVQSEDLTAVVQSVVATGGVYKGQGRNQRELMTRAYWEFLVHVENCKPRSLSTKEVQRVTRKPVGPGMLTHADSFSVARVRPRTSKGITDLLSLSLVRLFSSAACPSKKSLSSWEPAVALVTYRDPPATAANAARFTTEPQARQTHADQGMNPGRRTPAARRDADGAAAPDDRRGRRANAFGDTGPSRREREHGRPKPPAPRPPPTRIAPPTKNGHAPPPTESRKSSQSVNLSGVRACFGFPEAARRVLELGRYLIAFEPLTFVLDHTRTYLANAFASVRLETIQEFHL